MILYYFCLIINLKGDMNMKYVMLITYSWDRDYVAVPCNDDIEAMEWLNRYLDEEVKTILSLIFYRL